MAKGFNEKLHPRAKDGKFTRGGKKLAAKAVPTGGNSRREKVGEAIGNKIADVRKKSANATARRNRAVVVARNASDARYVAETGDTGGPRDRAALAARNARNLARAKKATATSRRISANRRKGGK